MTETVTVPAADLYPTPSSLSGFRRILAAHTDDRGRVTARVVATETIHNDHYPNGVERVTLLAWGTDVSGWFAERHLFYAIGPIGGDDV